MRGLAGRSAVVTGASSGIGRAIAVRLGEEGVKLCLVAAPADADELEQVAASVEAAGGSAFAFPGDVGDEATAPAVVAAAVERHGGLDLLANNAGIAHYESALEWDPAVFDRLHRVNVRGTYLMASAAARQMAPAHAGAMVFTASVSGFFGDEGMTVYNSTKAAVAALARSFAVDLAPKGLRVNAVAPGWIHTPATNFIIEGDAEEWARQRVRIPMDRAADPSEVAAVVAFLLSDDASYMTGSHVVVDGGQSAGLRGSGWAVRDADVVEASP